MNKMFAQLMTSIGLGVNAIAPNATAFVNTIKGKNIFPNADISVITEDYGKSFTLSVSDNTTTIALGYTIENCRVTSLEISQLR